MTDITQEIAQIQREANQRVAALLASQQAQQAQAAAQAQQQASEAAQAAQARLDASVALWSNEQAPAHQQRFEELAQEAAALTTQIRQVEALTADYVERARVLVANAELAAAAAAQDRVAVLDLAAADLDTARDEVRAVLADLGLDGIRLSVPEWLQVGRGNGMGRIRSTSGDSLHSHARLAVAEVVKKRQRK